jgi:hypothetical protein
MPLVDSHVHLYPTEANASPAAWAAARRESHWTQLCARRRKDGRPVQGFPSVGELLASMDAAGVGRAVLLGWYWENPATCSEQNRFFEQCIRAHPDRLSAFAALHPAAGLAASLDEVRRAYGEGFVGLGELSPHAQHYAVLDPTFASVLVLAAELRLPVSLHVTDPESGDYPGRVSTPLRDFLTLALAFPTTMFILAHWGGLLPLREAVAAKLPNLYYDTAASPLLYDERIWRRFAAAVPAGRVLFGSDYPLNLYPRIDAQPELSRFVAELHRSGLVAEELAAIGRDNATTLLRLK